MMMTRQHTNTAAMKLRVAGLTTCNST